MFYLFFRKKGHYGHNRKIWPYSHFNLKIAI